MLYIKCPTCGRILADKMILYEKGVKNINENNALTEKQKNDEKLKLINSFRIPDSNYCCKMRIMTYRSIVNIVK